jgi:heme exporter protein C
MFKINLKRLVTVKSYKYIRGATGFLALALLASLSFGLYFSLIASPADYEQGGAVRIMYVHVPSAWMSLLIYSFIGLLSIIYVVARNQFAFTVACAAAPTGACFAFITLVTGSIWGKPMWGAWWVWDARLTSMLILFFFYLSYIFIIRAARDIRRAALPASIVSITGLINVPLVKFSVNLWNSLHQDATISKIGSPSIDPAMMKPLLIMAISWMLFFVIDLIIRVEKLLNFNKIKRCKAKL